MALSPYYLHFANKIITVLIFFITKSAIQTSVVSQVRLPEDRLEGLFHSSDSIKGFGNSNLRNYENLTWCTLQTPAKGVVQVVFTNKKTNKMVCAEIPIT